MMRMEMPCRKQRFEMHFNWKRLPLLLCFATIMGIAIAQTQDPGKVSETFQYSFPAIAGYGKVVRLSDAVHQPRDGSKIVVDVTQGGKPDVLNPAIEKVARYFNIYRGAGKDPAQVHMAIVLHDDATLTVLTEDVYTKRFETQGNPNLDCLRELHQAGVEIIVCGQSLVSKKQIPGDVLPFADVAVSALTSLVNLQSDGYAYVPLGN